MGQASSVNESLEDWCEEDASVIGAAQRALRHERLLLEAAEVRRKRLQLEDESSELDHRRYVAGRTAWLLAEVGRTIGAETPDSGLESPAPTPAPQVDRSRRITVAELASQLGFSESATYRRLAQGAIPGAFKTDANSTKSHWYIPADAASRFRAKGGR